MGYLKKYLDLALQKKQENQKFIKRLKVKRPKDLDEVTRNFHEAAFIHINCLDCANCCKSLGPRITLKDIDRIAKFLNMKPDGFIQKYLRIDEDRDYVFQSMPCPFLGEDNYCSVYGVLPKACAEYPHTNRRKIHQILNLTLQNTVICPAVYEIVEELKKQYLK